MTADILSASKCFGGMQYVYEHAAETTQCPMRFSAFVPPQAETEKLPILYYLSGLTCTEENFTVKAAAQRHAAEHGIVVVAPDTSPRGDGIADDEAWDLGAGAGFYVNATQEPWRKNYQMYDYIVNELRRVVHETLPVDPMRESVFGHSMGGHGALTIALRNPDLFRSVSVLAPICAPIQTDLGKKVFSAYLGDDESAWRQYDATELVKDGHRTAPILIDQGDEDNFYKQGAMKLDEFQAACAKTGQPVTLRMQDGYDHGYFFVQTFTGDHIAYHAQALVA
jgi:S-formylglutathione hydrolase